MLRWMEPSCSTPNTFLASSPASPPRRRRWKLFSSGAQSFESFVYLYVTLYLLLPLLWLWQCCRYKRTKDQCRRGDKIIFWAERFVHIFTAKLFEVLKVSRHRLSRVLMSILDTYRALLHHLYTQSCYLTFYTEYNIIDNYPSSR